MQQNIHDIKSKGNEEYDPETIELVERILAKPTKKAFYELDSNKKYDKNIKQKLVIVNYKKKNKDE